MANTSMTYLYRDASNYKVWNEVVLKGEITEDQKDKILSCLNLGEYFIPSQVGLPEERFEKWTEDDHCWFELGKYSFRTPVDAPETVDMTVGELVDNFLAVGVNGWVERSEGGI